MKEDEAMKDDEEMLESGSFLAPNRRKSQGEEGSTSLWLITFTDVMALMLTFFVLLYSMSVPQEEEWNEMTSGLQNEFSKTYSAQSYEGPQDAVNIDKIDFSKAQSLTYLNSVLVNVIEKDERLKNIELIPQKDSLIISVPQELLFNSGQSDVSAKGKQVLFSMGNTMSRIRNRIEVIGHTDPSPIQNAETLYGSNWELSLARAASVSVILENAGYQRPIIIRGLSSSRYEDLPKEMNEEERLSLARRVDIVVMPDDGSVRNQSFEIDILR